MGDAARVVVDGGDALLGRVGLSGLFSVDDEAGEGFAGEYLRPEVAVEFLIVLAGLEDTGCPAQCVFAAEARRVGEAGVHVLDHAAVVRYDDAVRRLLHCAEDPVVVLEEPLVEGQAGRAVVGRCRYRVASLVQGRRDLFEDAPVSGAVPHESQTAAYTAFGVQDGPGGHADPCSHGRAVRAGVEDLALRLLALERPR